MDDQLLPVISDPFYTKSTWYQEIITGIRNASKSLRYQHDVTIFSDPVNEIDFSKLPPVVIVTNGSQGYVNATINALAKAGKHIVLSGLDSGHFGEMISCATSSRRTDMERLVYYLIGHGRKRIALVGFWRESINDMLFYHSAMSAAMRYGAPIAENSVYFWKEHLTESLDNFIKNAWQFDAAVCPNDTVALCLAKYCRVNQISIPENLYLTGISNMQIGRYCEPPLTTIAMNFNSIGEETLNVWHYIHTHFPRPTSIKVLVPGKLIVRASTDFKPEIPYSYAINAQSEMPNNFPDNQFFTDRLITELIRIENCLHQRDELDQKILVGIMQGKSYEALAEELFISISAIRYRRNKIFKDADVKTRAAFEHLIRENIGNIGEEIGE
jgi:DNA-binding LacI/PurR family transcriptional regulator